MSKLITTITILTLIIGLYLTWPRYIEMTHQEPVASWVEMMK